MTISKESFIERPIEEALSRLRMIKNMHWNRYDGYCMPAMDVHSSQKGIHVSVEMPGVHKVASFSLFYSRGHRFSSNKKDKVTVDIDKDILTVKVLLSFHSCRMHCTEVYVYRARGTTSRN